MLHFVILSLFVVSEAAPQTHIINGDVSELGKWPWQISLQRFNEDRGNFSHSCGGSLLTDEWVLTASHCLMLNEDPTAYEVKLGGFQLSEDDFEQVRKIDQIIEHPEFSMLNPGLPYDIAVIHLTEKVDMSSPNIDTVKLPLADTEFAGNEDCWISGWGRHKREESTPSDLLREKNIPVLTLDECKVWYDDLIDVLPLSEAHVCIGNPDIMDVHACHGDSGGPLSCNAGSADEQDWRIVAVASRTGPLDCENYPSVYTSVQTYLDFIRENVPDV